MAQSIPEIVGINARQIRLEVGATQEDVATAANDYGVEWTPQTLRAIESGRGNAGSLPAVFVLTFALSAVTNRPVLLPELLDAAGEDVTVAGIEVVGEKWEAIGAMRWAPVLGHEAIHPTPLPLTAEDRKALEALPCDEAAYRNLCAELWGQPLSAEVTARTDPDASQAKRANIVRRLVTELADELDFRLVWLD